jgi:predicted ferric reductase
MNDRIWWHIARSTGLVAWLALALAMITGGLLANRVVHRPMSVRRTVGLHRHLAAVGLGLVAVHLGALLADNYVKFSVADLLIPFHSTWRPAALAWGIASLAALTVVEVSSLAHRRLSKRTWRLVHQCSALGFASATVHLLQAGTDAATTPVRLSVAVITVVVTFLYLARLVRLRTDRPAATAIPQVTAPRHDRRGGVRLAHDNDVTSRKSLVQGQ